MAPPETKWSQWTPRNAWSTTKVIVAGSARLELLAVVMWRRLFLSYTLRLYNFPLFKLPLLYSVPDSFARLYPRQANVFKPFIATPTQSMDGSRLLFAIISYPLQ